LTFTFRQLNFTIERLDEVPVLPTNITHIIEILRPLDLPNRQGKIDPEPLKHPLNLRRLVNLMLRYRKSIGYSATIDLRGLSRDERALVLQSGLQAQDSLSKLGEHLVSPLLVSDDTAFSESVVRPVTKLRFFSADKPSDFFISELLECVSPSFPRTLSYSLKGATKDHLAQFNVELQSLQSSTVLGDSPIAFFPTMQQLMRKVYRSLGIDEIANIAPFPREPIPGITHKRYKSFVPPISDLSFEGILLGTVRTEASSEANEVRLPPADRLRHLYVIGKTGTGKSSFLASLIIQDIVNNLGVVVVDPHGDLCDDVVSALPERCLENVILVDPMLSASYPKCSLNVLDIGSSSKSDEELAQAKDYWTGELTSMFLSLYGSEVFGPRIQEYFQAACLTLMSSRVAGTLVDVPRLFVDADFRNQVREATKGDLYVNEFWSGYDASGSRERDEILPYFTSKFSPLVRSHAIRNFVGQSVSALKIDEYISNRKACLIRLSKGRLGELQMRLIGMLLFSKLKSSVFMRQSEEVSSRKPVMLYVDEFQNFMFEGFQTLLSEARKYGLGLVLAHQYLAQLRQERFQLYGSGRDAGLLPAILGNVGSVAVFRVGSTDGAEMAPHLAEPVEAKDLVNIENYSFVARLLNDGVLGAPMTVSAYRHEFLTHATFPEERQARIDYVMNQFR
jgi:hypothetical protein